MKIPIIMMFLLIILSVSADSFGNNIEEANENALQILVFDQDLPITVDGDLSDWDAAKRLIPKIIVNNSIFGFEKPNSSEDLSGWFSIVADGNNIFLAVKVVDDSLVFGESYSGRAYWDDALEVRFVSSKRVELVVSADKQGKTRTDISINHQYFPFVSELIGIESSLQITDDGYVVEMAIPLTILELTYFKVNKGLSMAVRIWDDDDGGYQESGIDWREKAVNNTKPFSEKELINKFLFVKVDINESDNLNRVRLLDGSRKILDMPPNYDDESVPIINALKNFYEGDLKSAKSELSKIGDTFKIEALYATMMRYAARSDEDVSDAIKATIAVRELCPDERLSRWMEIAVNEYTHIARDMMGHGFPESAEIYFHALAETRDIKVRKEVLKLLSFMYMQRHEQGETQKALKCIEAILEIDPDDYVANTLKEILEKRSTP